MYSSSVYWFLCTFRFNGSNQFSGEFSSTANLKASSHQLRTISHFMSSLGLYCNLESTFVLAFGKSFTGSRPGPEVIKIFSCSTQLSMKFKLLINTEIGQIN